MCYNINIILSYGGYSMSDENDAIFEEKRVNRGMNMARGSTFYMIWNIVEALILLAGGILCIVFSDNKDLQKTFLTIISIFLIVDGGLRILVNFLPIITLVNKKKITSGLVVTGAVELAIGITILCDIMSNGEEVINTILKFLSLFVGIVLLVLGAISLIYSIGFASNKFLNLRKFSICGLIVAAGLITLGVVCIIYLKDSEVTNKIALIIAGIFLAFTGVVQFLTAILEHRKYRLRDELRDKVYDAVDSLRPDDDIDEEINVDDSSSNK